VSRSSLEGFSGLMHQLLQSGDSLALTSTDTRPFAFQSVMPREPQVEPIPAPDLVCVQSIANQFIGGLG
jgi:hypothetical protein